MLLSKKPIFFPVIDNPQQLEGQTGITHDRFMEISGKYKIHTNGYDFMKIPLRMQLESLLQVCRGDIEYFVMLMLIGMDTQAIIGSKQFIAGKFNYNDQTSLGIEKPVIFPGFDNWDRVITEFGFNEDKLNEICNAYTASIAGKDFRKIKFPEFLYILKCACQGKYYLDIMLLNIGMDTQNMVFCNSHVNPDA